MAASVLPASAEYTYFVVPAPYDPAVPGVVATELWSTKSYFFDANDGTMPNKQFRGWCTTALTSNRTMMPSSGEPGGRALPAQAAVILTVGDEFAARRAYYKTLRWAGWGVSVYRGIKSDVTGKVGAFSDLQLLLTGSFAAEPDFNKTTFSVPISDLGILLAQIFAPATYGGTGGFDGSSNIAGQYKPDAVGEVFGVQGVWVDTTSLWMDLCASGFASVAKVSDGADVLTADPSNPPAAGKYYVDATNGRIRFGSSATFTYRVDFTSNFASGSTKVGDIASAVLTRAGYSSGQIDGGAFTGLNTSRPEKVGWYCANGEKFQDLIDAIVGGMMCYLTADPSNGGKLTIGKVHTPTATAQTDSVVSLVITDRILLPNTFSRTGTASPASRLDVMAQQNWTVLTDNQLAGAALTADKDFARNQWRTIANPNATTAAQFPLAVPLQLKTPMADLTEAATAGAEWSEFMTTLQPMAKCTLAVPPFGLAIGAEVWVNSAVNEVNAPAIVSEIDESSNTNQVTLTLWALQE